MDFLRAWIRNLWIDIIVVTGVGIFMIIFMRIFYPEALGVVFLSGQFAVGMVNVLKLWPLVILGIFVHALPRRSQWQSRKKRSPRVRP